MNIFVCLDEVGGMTFNKRRQSSDRVIREDILQTIGENKLYVNSYTAKQFEEDNRLLIDDNCIGNTKPGDYLFLENIPVSNYISEIESIIVYRWQRKYPADFFFDIDLTSDDWQLSSSEELKGYSHETIIKEIYKKTVRSIENEE